MLNFKNISLPLILHSGFPIQDDTATYLNLNFVWLTEITIPNLYFFYQSSKKNIFLYSPRLTTKQKKELVSILGKKIKFCQLSEFKKLVSSHITTLYTLSNWNQQKIKIPIVNLNTTHLDEMCELGRKIKSKTEIARVRKSALLVSQGIMKMWKELSNLRGKTTQSLVRFLKKNIKLDELAYPIICSTGSNITELHYHLYDSPLNPTSIILLDIGFKYQNYCCDITRCFPRNGKFTTPQRNIYQLVLDCQELILSKIKPGVNFSELETLTYIFLFQGLEKLGILLPNNLSNSEKANWIHTHMMYHSLGHPVGLHVHDTSKTKTDKLEVNMIYAIEPGLYFTDSLQSQKLVNLTELLKYFDIGGIRIEDTILITETGYEILNKINSKKVLPKNIEDIEKIIN